VGFHEVRFPTDIAYGSQGGPGFSTSIVVTDSGAEQRVANWSAPRHRFDAAYAVRSYAQLQIVKAFYAARLGPANGFRYKDFFDFTTHVDGKSAHTNADQPIGTGNGTLATFQLVKQYGSSPVRTFKITKPVEGTVLVKVGAASQTEGVDFTVDHTTGIVLFSNIPGAEAITAGCQFDKPVRFTEDVDEALSATYENFGSGSIAFLPLIELIDEAPFSDEFYYGGAAIISPMSASVMVTELSGRVHVLAPDASTYSFFLPPFVSLPTGGPWFYLQNISANNLSVRDDDAVEIGVLAGNSSMEIWLGLSNATTKQWYGLT